MVVKFDEKTRPEIIIGNEQILSERPAIGPAGHILCNEHQYVKIEFLLCAGAYIPVCYKCILFNQIVEIAQRVQTPGERGSRSFPLGPRSAK